MFIKFNGCALFFCVIVQSYSFSCYFFVQSISNRLCICKSEAEVKTKLHPGDVLVIPSTSNEILEYLKKASAIIAEEPGLNSHAAIVGLTLEKPVIVGATSATHVLKDGVKVAVDAERGIVRMMPE